MQTYTIEQRKMVLVNTDPQRRCYNGCHAKSDLVWTQWEFLEVGLTEDKVQERMSFWRDLNDYAVESRGSRAKRQFRIVPEQEIVK